MEAAPLSNGMVGPDAGVETKVHDSLEMLAGLYAYNHWCYDRLRPFLRGSICDVGAGTGNIIQFLLNYERVVGLEPYRPSLEKARRRFRDHGNVKFVQAWIEDCPNDEVPANSFDAVTCLRQLGSMEDDVGTLRRMRQLCRRDGNVVIVAAAQMSAYGVLDRAVGHRRRYNRRTLARAFRAAGLRVTHGFYMNSLGYFGWLWQSRILRRTNISTAGASMINRLIPYIDAFERIFKPPFRQAVVRGCRVEGP